MNSFVEVSRHVIEAVEALKDVCNDLIDVRDARLVIARRSIVAAQDALASYMNTPTKPTISSCSVKVMRSHDYCHFEVVLGADAVSSTEQVDALRKEAARLADKAVAQYKIAKKNAEKIQSERTTRGYHIQRMERIQQTPEGERTVEEQAQLKAFRDEQWAASRSYDYEDGWSEEDED